MIYFYLLVFTESAHQGILALPRPVCEAMSGEKFKHYNQYDFLKII